MGIKVDFQFENKTRSYYTFKVEDDNTNYQLTISGFIGITPTGSILYHHGRAFNLNCNPGQYGFILFLGTYYNPRWIEMKIHLWECKPQAQWQWLKTVIVTLYFSLELFLIAFQYYTRSLYMYVWVLSRAGHSIKRTELHYSTNS